MAEKVLEEKREKNVAACFADSLSLPGTGLQEIWLENFCGHFGNPLLGLQLHALLKSSKLQHRYIHRRCKLGLMAQPKTNLKLPVNVGICNKPLQSFSANCTC
jgi:hypothetical protein